MPAESKRQASHTHLHPLFCIPLLPLQQSFLPAAVACACLLGLLLCACAACMAHAWRMQAWRATPLHTPNRTQQRQGPA